MSSSIPRDSSSSYRLQRQGERQLKRMDLTIRVFALVAVILFALTIIFLGITQAGYIHPVAALYSFAAILPVGIVIKMIDCCRDPIANKYRIDLDAYDTIMS